MRPQSPNTPQLRRLSRSSPRSAELQGHPEQRQGLATGCHQSKEYTSRFDVCRLKAQQPLGKFCFNLKPVEVPGRVSKSANKMRLGMQTANTTPGME